MSTVISAPAEASRLDIVQGILDLIASRDLQINSMTSESELARKLSLSGRSPVIREALALLTRDGIVQPRPQRGYLIREISTDEAKEILRLRAASEKIVVEKLATLELSLRLDRAKGHRDHLCESSHREDCTTFLNFEGRLCRELARLSGLFTATQVVGAWSDQLRVFHASAPLGRGEMEQISDSYSTLLECVEEHDAQSAVATIDAQVQVRIENLNARSSDNYVSDSVNAVTEVPALVAG